MTRQLRDKNRFHFGAATVELAIHWHQDHRRSLSGQETFNYPGFIPPDPRALLEEFLELAMEDRDRVVAFLETCGYLLDEPRPGSEFIDVTIDGNLATQDVQEKLARDFKRVIDRELGALNFPLENKMLHSWLARRLFLRQWLSATGSEILTALAKEFSEEVEDARRAFRAALTWSNGTPYLTLHAADAWEAMLAVVHVQKMMGARRRICLRPGCTKLVLITSASGQKKKYCCKSCRLAHNSRRYRRRQRG